MNPVLKAIAEHGLLASGAARVRRAGLRNDVLVLAYHNVLAPGEVVSGDASLHLPHARFVAQLDALARTHRVVSLASLGEPHDGRRPRVVITFDDAYRSALSAAIPELASRGMSATIFVAPGLLGQTTWWDALAEPVGGGVAADRRDRALWLFHGDAPAVFTGLGASPGNTTQRIATEDELAHVASTPGITIGSHSWTHSNLASLTNESLERELRSSRDWLASRFQSFVPWLAYPYGLFSPEVERAAAAAGYTGAMRVDGGWVHDAAAITPWAIPRFNVPSGLSTAGFRLRLSGIGS